MSRGVSIGARESPSNGCPPLAASRLQKETPRVRNLLRTLSQGRRVHLWWLESTGGSELTLCLLAGPDSRLWSLRLHESSLNGPDAFALPELRERIASLLDSVPNIRR